jgi:hypothetical protein
MIDWLETQGLTQLNIANVLEDPDLQPLAAKYGIEGEKDLFDPEKSAIASILYASKAMRQARSAYKAGQKQGLTRTFRPNPRSGTYDGDSFVVDKADGGVKRVRLPKYGSTLERGITKLFTRESYPDRITKMLNKAAGQNIYKARWDEGKLVVDKKTKGNPKNDKKLSDDEIFFYYWQTPSALRYGDAQGGSKYVQKSVDFLKTIKAE